MSQQPTMDDRIAQARQTADAKAFAFHSTGACGMPLQVDLNHVWLVEFAGALLASSDRAVADLKTELARATSCAQQAERDANFANECADKWARKLTDARAQLTDARREAGREAALAIRQAWKDTPLGGDCVDEMMKAIDVFAAPTAPPTVTGPVGKVVAAFIGPDTSAWQGASVNVTEDGAWYVFTGQAWTRTQPPIVALATPQGGRTPTPEERAKP